MVMKYEKTNVKKGIALLLSAVMFGTTLFVYNPLQTNATETAVQGDYNQDGNLELGDLIDWVTSGQSSSDDANSLRTELLRIVDSSVENDDGTFEGNTGIVSIYNSRLLKDSFAYGAAAFVDFQSVKTNEGNKLHVASRSNTGSAYDMIYIRFDRKVENGATYQVGMDLEALNDNYTDGLWKYAIVDPTMNMYTIVAPTPVAGNELFTEGRTFEFTAKKDCDYFYLVLFEYNNGASGVWMDFTIDNIKLNGTSPIVTSVEGDDGRFEGNSGIISLYNSRLLEGSFAYGSSAFIDFKRVITNDETKLHVTSRSSTGGAYDMVYIKVNQKVETGVTYQVSMDLEALNDNYADGLWKYAIVDPTMNMYTIVAPTPVAGNELFTEGRTFEFTAKKDCDYFYLVLFEYNNGAAGVWMNFTIDNIKLTRVFPASTTVLSDDGTFEGKQGSVSLYSVSALATELGGSNVSEYARWQNDNVTFQRIETENGVSVSIKSSDVSSDRGGLVYIKFANKLKANTEYTISYNAKWTGETLPTATNGEYAILQSASKWITSTHNPIATFRKPQTGSMFDGTATVTFTPTEDCDEFYLVLHLQNGDVNFDMEIDNITVTEKQVTE
jgi:hypothetical protein